MTHLSKELSSALRATDNNGLVVVDPETQRTYVVVDADLHRQAMAALRRQQDHEAIAQGIAEMEAGDTVPVEEARQSARERLLARRP